MAPSMTLDDMLQEAQRILQLNDRGAYTVPTHGLYPFQWNWDSCLTALGQHHFSPDRAWTELETLMAHQWPDGMVPHIVFHEPDDGYFPGPDVWRTPRPTPTSGITQPPVLGLVLEQLFLRSPDPEVVKPRCAALLAAAVRWHDWFYRCRDPQDTGLVALLHPWESGRDNATDWVAALAAVPADQVGLYTRKDITHVDPSERPTQFEYDRYVALVQAFRAMDWDNTRLHDASPFQVVDPGFNAILIHAEQALARLARQLGQVALAERLERRAARCVVQLETLWNPILGQYGCWDRRVQVAVHSPSVGGLLPLLVLPEMHPRRVALGEQLGRWLDLAPFGVSSMDPSDARFDGHRYWRGPSWLIINYLLLRGLRQGGQTALAQRVVDASLACIGRGGFSEYYHPVTGQALGGGTFTWSAAMVVEFLSKPSNP